MMSWSFQSFEPRQAIIAMKGCPSAAKRKLACSVAKCVRCPLMDTDVLFPALEQCLPSCLEAHNNLINFSHEAVCLMAQAQLQLNLSVFVNSPLSDQLHFNRLVDLAASNNVTLLLIDCRLQEDGYFLPDYDTGDVNKLILELNTDEDEVVYRALQFITSGLDLAVDFNHNSNLISIDDEDELGKGESKVEEEESDSKKDDEKMLKDYTHYSFHPALVFCDDDDHDGISCNACLKPISGPIYNCVECQFFLHKSCAELPYKTPSPICNDLRPFCLRFVDKTRLTNVCCPFCSACGDYGNCFYVSESYNYELDPKCAKIASKIETEFHPHSLYLCWFDKSIGCKACGISSVGIYYTCSECELYLHVQCAKLPSRIKHECHCDILTLTMSSPLDEYDQYCCDVCETDRDPSHWFYYCSDCDFAAHLNCVISEVKTSRPIWSDLTVKAWSTFC